jgi:hypothetical protein
MSEKLYPPVLALPISHGNFNMSINPYLRYMILQSVDTEHNARYGAILFLFVTVHTPAGWHWCYWWKLPHLVNTSGGMWGRVIPIITTTTRTFAASFQAPEHQMLYYMAYLASIPYILESNPHPNLIRTSFLPAWIVRTARTPALSCGQNPALDRESNPHSILIRICLFSPLQL